MLYVLAGAAACLFLGDVYWLAHLIIRGEPPTIFSACDVAYIGFLLMFNAALPRVEPRRSLRHPFTLCMAAFALLNAAAWMVWTGVWFNNLLWGIPMLVLGPAQRHAGGSKAVRGPVRRIFRIAGPAGRL